MISRRTWCHVRSRVLLKKMIIARHLLFTRIREVGLRLELPLLGLLHQHLLRPRIHAVGGTQVVVEGPPPPLLLLPPPPRLLLHLLSTIQMKSHQSSCPARTRLRHPMTTITKALRHWSRSGRTAPEGPRQIPGTFQIRGEELQRLTGEALPVGVLHLAMVHESSCGALLTGQK